MANRLQEAIEGSAATQAPEVVSRSPEADLAQVAADHGYADHAHLTRDFRRMLGFTSTDYRSRP